MKPPRKPQMRLALSPICDQCGTMLLAHTLKQIEAFYGQRFLRIHRATLVALDQVDVFMMPNPMRGTPAHVYLTALDEPLAVSRRHVPAVRRALEPPRAPVS